MCWYKEGGQNVFGEVIWGDFICKVCGGDIRKPPTQYEWGKQMSTRGYVDGDEVSD